MTKLCFGQKLTAAFLSFVLFSQPLCQTAMAFSVEQKVTATGLSGEVVTNDESWEELYPNGYIVFKDSQIHLSENVENENKKSLKVYRFGGTEGEVKIQVMLTPSKVEGNIAYSAGRSKFNIVEPQIEIEKTEATEHEPIPLEIVFKDGEYEKDIVIEAIDNDIHESVKMLLATIVATEGTEHQETMNRSTFVFHDDEEMIDSEVYADSQPIIGDQNAEYVSVILKRTGGTMYNFAVDYTTKEATVEKDGLKPAVVNKDFVATTAQATFNPFEEEIELKIPVINNEETAENPDRYFYVELSNPLGGTIKQGDETILVHLKNSYKSGDGKLHTVANAVFADPAEDVSSLAIIDDSGIFSKPDTKISVETTKVQQQEMEAEKKAEIQPANALQEIVPFELRKALGDPITISSNPSSSKSSVAAIGAKSQYLQNRGGLNEHGKQWNTVCMDITGNYSESDFNLVMFDNGKYPVL